MEQIKNCETLDELFKLWKTEDNHELFGIDGFIDKDTFDKQEKRVLFIAKESNISKDEPENTFWLQDVALKGKTSTILSRRVLIMTNELFGKNFDNTDRNILKNIAYMNINKRGGGSIANNKQLKDYAENYKDYIAREIEIINPNLIICCSSLVHNIFNDYIKDNLNNQNIPTICVYHPSWYFISDKNYLKKFKDGIDFLKNNSK